MRFTIRREPLLDALVRVQSSVERKSPVAVLGSLLCEVSAERLSVFGTDLEIGMRTRVAVADALPGRVALGARSLLEIVRELPSQAELRVSRKENGWVEIASGPYRFDLLGMAPQEYAPITYLPSFEEKSYFPVRPAALSEMIDKTVFALSTDTALYHLNGVLLEECPGGARMVATDTYRLSYVGSELFLESPRESGKAARPLANVIIPKKGLVELRKLLEGAGSAGLAFERGQLYAQVGDTYLFVRLIEGEYIDYRRIVPTETEHTVVLDRERFAADLRRISLLAPEKTRSIRLSLGQGRMEIACSNSELGEARGLLEVDYSGEKLEIGFNARYLLEYLNASRSPEVELSFKSRLSAAILRDRGRQDQAYVLMPMRI
ncbi:MAG: DNA polymerase III subunit beta [Oligoflexia bacterium]|nr:DNA polymerase III subunit beta [Oligoflexia bacterium]